VFVSHRRADKDSALRVACLAWGEGFDYWLDILDLDPLLNKQIKMLERKLGHSLTPLEKSFLLAAIIEMALLNCTHVLALMTLNTAGSLWVPYEYGRMKKKTMRSPSTSCWWDTKSLLKDDLPEYVYLADIHHDEHEICNWFRHELRQRQFAGCSKARQGAWPHKATNVLPTG
jgi:hypothetical protein